LNPCRRFALTAGEPAGIGPDLCVQLAQYSQDNELIVIAAPELLQQRAEQLGLSIQLEKADLQQIPKPTPAGIIRYLPVELDCNVIAGALDLRNANYVLATLTTALELCMQGKCDALITGPVHKSVINDAGFDFTGHTEFFAQGAGVERVVMMLATPTLRVALVTTHLPLTKVSQAITRASLTETIAILSADLTTKFSIASPRIAVCGLNPHAGEGGHLGSEEIDIISPVIEDFKSQGYRISGPWPADTIFVQDRLKEFDVVLAMYHDQGLPVLKHSGFSQAVNITLGLPFIRTSVDHGTALDLAGTGLTKIGSLKAAVEMAAQTVNSGSKNGE
jgi:4-hydroxythreonine-4-phosphate dehydrogenase